MHKAPIAVVTGTRPELIKMAPVMKELKKQHVPFTFIHSDQHYSQEMDEDIIKNLDLPPINFHVNVGFGSHAVLTGRIMEGVERVFQQIHPQIVVVHGDTNTTLGSALTAVKMHIKVAHVEAGLRSFDYAMPEEVNRMLTDRISDLLFTPTETSRGYLLKEGIQESRIIVTGNTVVDALRQHITIARKKSQILKKLGVKKYDYMLATAHREENVDTQVQLEKVLHILYALSDEIGKKIIYPIHPRTASNLKSFGLRVNARKIRCIPPVDYLDTLMLIENAALVVTDSGGLQEEAYLLKRPLITIRTTTERPETLSANAIVGLDIEKALAAWRAYTAHKFSWEDQSIGDGKASVRIVDALRKTIGG